MENANITIIGAGIVGLAIASEMEEENVIIIEKNESFGKETSSRNSEVIHAGIYYPNNSLKAKLCIEGKELTYKICEEHNIPHKKIGKFIVATNKFELNKLENLYKNALINGVDAKIITQNELRKIEPNVVAIAALYSPSTGILDTHEIMKYFERIAREKGVMIAYNFEVIGIDKTTNGYVITVKDKLNNIEKLFSHIVINSAGLYADKVANMVGLDIDKLNYKISFYKGEYFAVDNKKSKMVSHLIYPVPSSFTLGIHTVIDIEGQLKLGPSSFLVDKIDYSVNEENKKYFVESVKSFLPFITLEDLTPAMAGIRPKAQEDFIIKEESENGFPGFINLIGIDSPGVTAAPAIAKYVKKLVDCILK
jgi:L-2-hydroxyglutarate oxidase LhgO